MFSTAAFGAAFKEQTAASTGHAVTYSIAHNTLCRRGFTADIWKRGGGSVIRKWHSKQIEVSLADRSGPRGKEVDSFLQDGVIDLNNSTLHLMGCVIWRYPCGIHNPSLICQRHRGAHCYLCDLWRISLKGQFVIHARPGFGTSIDSRWFKWETMGDDRENRNEGCLQRESLLTRKQKSIVFNAVGDEGHAKM